jgi:subtilase family serine protease
MSRRSPARSRSLARRGVSGLALALALISLGGCGGSAAAKSTSQVSRAAAEADCRRPAASACYTPQLLRVAYGIQPLLNRGVDGRGQTVVLQEFAPKQGPDPGSTVPVTDIRQDLSLFDTVFGLPSAQLQVDTGLAASASPWSATSEEVEDAEIVHAVAPDATIRVILIPQEPSAASVVAATDAVLRLAVSQGAVVLIAGDADERCYTSAEVAGFNSALEAAEDHQVTVVSDSNDFGVVRPTCSGTGKPIKGVGLYAADPLVLTAGGTSLVANRTTGAYISETAWKSTGAAPAVSSAPSPAGPPGQVLPSVSGPSSVIEYASGGGFSQLFRRPAYQNGVPGIGAYRGVPDVAADADPATGMTLALNEGAGKYAFFPASGTSAAGPLWAALIALADQYAGRHLGFVNPAIYRIGLSANYHQAFHDITKGNNTVAGPLQTVIGYQASSGWDPVTGWGSPNAQVLVPMLAR